MKKNLKSICKNIKAVIFDVDGILTNGQIVMDHEGREIKIFNVQDGFGIHLLKKAGIKTAILSARSAEAVTKRAEDLKIDKVFQNAYPKIHAYKDLCRELNVKDQEVCFIGDDLPDLCILKKVGFSVSVPNAADFVKDNVDYVTKKKGGRGAVRELCEMLLKYQGKLKSLEHEYLEVT